jgi:hypothetical protein
MSDRETEVSQNIFSGIHITIMLTATFRTSPIPYSKVCDTFRPRIGQCAAVRTDLGGKSFTHFFKPGAMLNSLVRKLISKGRPTGIQYGLRHIGLGEPSGIHVADGNVVKFSHNAMRQFVLKIISPIRHFRIDGLDASFFPARCATASAFSAPR